AILLVSLPCIRITPLLVRARSPPSTAVATLECRADCASCRNYPVQKANEPPDRSSGSFCVCQACALLHQFRQRGAKVGGGPDGGHAGLVECGELGRRGTLAAGDDGAGMAHA